MTCMTSTYRKPGGVQPPPPNIFRFRLRIYTHAHLQMHTWTYIKYGWTPSEKIFWLRPGRKHSVENFMVNINSSIAFCAYGSFGACSLKPLHPRFLPTSLSTPSYPPPPCSSLKAHPHLRLASVARPFVTGHRATQGDCCSHFCATYTHRHTEFTFAHIATAP